MKSICNNCMNFPCTDDMSVMLKSCPAYNPKPKPQTNADHLRSLTDEELVEYLAHHQFCVEYCYCKYLRCEPCIAEWLKQEATVIEVDICN